MHYHPGFGRAAKGEALVNADVLRSKKWNNDGYGGGVERNNVSVEEDDHSTNSSSSSSSSSSSDDNRLQSTNTPSDNTTTTTTAAITCGDYGARQAERLLDWAISMNLVSRGLFNNTTSGPTHGDDEYINDPMARSPNSTCVNIIETYLLPTAYGGAGGGTTQYNAAATTTTVADIIIVGDDDDGIMGW
jgi:hypothetical protein